MKRVLVYALGLIPMMFFCASCEEAPVEEQVEKPEIILQTDQQITLNPVGDDVAVSFYSAMSWTAGLSSVSNVEEWMSISKTSGGKGDISINVVADANSTGRKRTASLDIISEGITKSIVFTQESTELKGNNATKEVGRDGGTLEWNVEYSGSYEVDIDVDWISHTDTRALENAFLIFEVEPNDGQERTGKVTVSGSGKEIVMTVNQEAGEDVEEKPVFRLLSNSATVSADGGRVEVTLETNVEYEYHIVDDWVSEVETKAVVEKTHVFEVEANLTSEARTALVTFCASTTCIPFTIKQEAAEPEPEDPYLEVDKTELIVEADELDAHEINVESNVEWTVRSDKSSWCKVSRPKGEGNGTFEITCSENTSYDDRGAVVTVSAGNLSREIVVTQKAAEEPEGYLEVSYANLSFSEKSSKKSLTVYSNEDWTVESDSWWCTVSPENGSGDTDVIVSVTANESNDSRTAGLVFRSESCEVVVTVTQEGTDVPVEDPYLEVDTPGWTLLAHTAASKEVNVVSNVEWNAYTDADWCSVSPSSGDGNGVIKVTAKENDTKKSREAVVTISSATLTCRIVVIQPGSSGTEGFEDEDDELDWDNN